MKWPDMNLNPVAVPWGRQVQNAILTLQADSDRRAQGELNTNKGQSATLRALGENIVDLSGRVTEAFAALTVRGDQITTGTIDNARLGTIPQTQLSGTWDKPVSTSGSGQFDGGLTSAGASALDLSTIPGPRQPSWQHIASGAFGCAPSTLNTKVDVSEVLPFTAHDVYEATPHVWHYINQLAIRDDPDNEYYDHDYEVPLELGLIAEYLIAKNMGIFVVLDEHGEPKTVDLALFGAIANLVAVRDLNARLELLEAG